MTAILITGAGRGIGLELAKQALAMGWKVYGSVRSEADAIRLSGDLGVPVSATGQTDANFVPMVFDVTDHEAVRSTAGRIDGVIDIVINNAGIIGPSRQSTLDMDFAGFAETLAVNTIAPLNVAQAFLPHLKRSDRPRLITISSFMGSLSRQKSDRIAYRASKAAVNKVSQGLATDLRKDGIAVISMHPGWVRTDMGGQAADIAPEESAAGILAVAEGLTLEQTGRFINHDGAELGW